jgi:hypothetical protein
LHELELAAIEKPVGRYGLEVIRLAANATIPASYWGGSEAGLAGRCLFVRPDTPVHSVLHEACHYVCMCPERRTALWRDAGGDVDEESAVCYLQVLLADSVSGLGRQQLLRDLDAWGYSFREGSARRWFEGDGRAARRWLESNDLVDTAGVPTWKLRV